MCEATFPRFYLGSLIMTASVSVEISPSELIDKITILEIKLDRIKDAEKLVNVKHEFETLTAARDDALEQTPELDRLLVRIRKDLRKNRVAVEAWTEL